MLKKAFVFLLILSPLLAVPKQSRANWVDDLIHDIFGNDKDNKDKDKKDPDPNCGNGSSVPVNGGLVILFAAGLGLGTWIVYDRRKTKEVTA